YRDLPMRFADYSTLFRKERTGALAGIFRVRQLTQDDSHVFCREDQVIEEINLALNLVRKQYQPFGLEPAFKLATRPEKRLGSDEFWDMAEGKLRQALEAIEIRAEIDDRSERMQAKLRDAQEQQIPVMLVVGDRDQEARAVSPRLRTGAASQGVPLGAFIDELRTRIVARELWPAQVQ